jgi:hypothetical protein
MCGRVPSWEPLRGRLVAAILLVGPLARGQGLEGHGVGKGRCISMREEAPEPSPSRSHSVASSPGSLFMNNPG